MSTFKCPICGSHEYESIKKSNGVRGPGFKEWVAYHFCKGCTVHFSDPEKFSVIIILDKPIIEFVTEELKKTKTEKRTAALLIDVVSCASNNWRSTDGTRGETMTVENFLNSIYYSRQELLKHRLAGRKTVALFQEILMRYKISLNV